MRWAALAAVGLVAAGCGAEPDTVAADPCGDAFNAADAIPGGESADQEILETLNVCENVAEWLVVAQEYPGAFGRTESDLNDATLSLLVACNSFPDTQVCRDAVETDVLE